MHWMIVPSQNSYVEALPLKMMMVLGGKMFGWLNLVEVMKVQSPWSA